MTGSTGRVGLLVLVAACASEDDGARCQAAAEHLSTCTGAPLGDAAACDPGVADAILAESCGELVESKADGEVLTCLFYDCFFDFAGTLRDASGRPAAGFEMSTRAGRVIVDASGAFGWKGLFYLDAVFLDVASPAGPVSCGSFSLPETGRVYGPATLTVSYVVEVDAAGNAIACSRAR